MPLVPKTKAKSPGDERQEAIKQLELLTEDWLAMRAGRKATNMLPAQVWQRIEFQLQVLWDCLVIEKQRELTCSTTEAAAVLHLAFDMAERDA
jgi:hypothetical protein